MDQALPRGKIVPDARSAPPQGIPRAALATHMRRIASTESASTLYFLPVECRDSGVTRDRAPSSAGNLGGEFVPAARHGAYGPSHGSVSAPSTILRAV